MQTKNALEKKLPSSRALLSFFFSPYQKIEEIVDTAIYIGVMIVENFTFCTGGRDAWWNPIIIFRAVRQKILQGRLGRWHRKWRKRTSDDLILRSITRLNKTIYQFQNFGFGLWIKIAFYFSIFIHLYVNIIMIDLEGCWILTENLGKE